MPGCREKTTLQRPSSRQIIVKLVKNRQNTPCIGYSCKLTNVLHFD